MPNILIIDDNDVFREALAETLRVAGMKVTEASDGKKGVDIFVPNALDFDVVVTDIFMPNQDGFATISGIKDVNPKVAIIAMSAGGSIMSHGNYLQHAKEFGADAIYYKSEEPKKLIDAINELIK